MLMKKTLRFSILSMLLMLCGHVAAEEITISAADMQAAAEGPTTVNGITFLAEKNNGSTAPTFNANNGDFRIYAKGTLTVSAEQNITKMVFNISTQGKKRLAPITASVGAIAEQALGDETVTWSGEATNVVLTVGDKANYGSDGDSKAGQFDFDSVTITLEGAVTIKTAKPVITPNGGEFEESIEVTLNHEDPNAVILYTLNTTDWNMAKEATPGTKITLTQTTVLRAKAFDYATEWSDVVTVTFTKVEPVEVVVGTCADVIAGTDGIVYQVKGKCTNILNTTYGNWDLEDETGTIRIYGTLDAEGNTKNFASLGIEEGDIVTVQGPRKDYNGTIELTDVTVISIEKGSTPPDPGVVIGTCQDVINGEDGTVFQVKGKCIEILNATFGNWDLQDETGTIRIYGTLDADGQPRNFTSLGIEVGDIVTVQGPRKDYNGTIELTDVTVISIEKGTAPTIEEISVGRALQIIDGLADGAKTEKEYDITGYIVSIKEVSPKVGDQGFGNATYDINDEAGVLEDALTVYRGLYLNNEYFTAEDQIAVGDKVVVRGKLQRYVKNGEMTPEVAQGNYIVSKGTATAINQMSVETESGIVYNLQGQRVAQPTKGLYIIGGKKMVKK